MRLVARISPDHTAVESRIPEVNTVSSGPEEKMGSIVYSIPPKTADPRAVISRAMLPIAPTIFMIFILVFITHRQFFS